MHQPADNVSTESEIRSQGPRKREGTVFASWFPASIAAATICAAYVEVHGEASPLAVAWAATFLFFVVEEDLRRRRIPNWLTLPGLGFSVLLSVLAAGWLGLASALLGAGLAFAIFFPLFLLRWMGAGDAKALMVLGALWGPGALLGGVWWMLLAGGAMALACLVARGGLRDLLRRWMASLWASLVLRRPTYLPPGPASPARGGVPFGLAIGLGAVAYWMWGVPWIG